MISPEADVHRSLAYRSDRALLAEVPFALFVSALGLSIVAFQDEVGRGQLLIAAFLIIAGLGWTLVALWRLRSPGPPRYVLSPDGILYKNPGLKPLVIPWSVVEDVQSTDITYFHWATRIPRYITFRNVTVVLVPKAFYDAHIDVRSTFKRGPTWGMNFQMKGQTVQVALHHEVVSVLPQSLRRAVEARWRVFRDAPPSAAAASTDTLIDATHDAPQKGPSVWRIAKFAIPSIAIVALLANIAGIWTTSGQVEAREKRKHWKEHGERWQADSKRLRDERDQAKKRMDDLLKDR